MITIGGIFGVIGIFGIGFLGLRLVFKIIVNLLRESGKSLPGWLKKAVQFVNKSHRLVGILTVSAIIIHFILQFISYGYATTAGLLAAAALLLQAGLGLLLRAQKNKAKRQKFVVAHTAWGLILVAAVLNHRLKIF
jgi:heme A synthase